MGQSYRSVVKKRVVDNYSDRQNEGECSLLYLFRFPVL